MRNSSKFKSDFDRQYNDIQRTHKRVEIMIYTIWFIMFALLIGGSILSAKIAFSLDYSHGVRGVLEQLWTGDPPTSLQ